MKRMRPSAMPEPHPEWPTMDPHVWLTKKSWLDRWDDMTGPERMREITLDLRIADKILRKLLDPRMRPTRKMPAGRKPEPTR